MGQTSTRGSGWLNERTTARRDAEREVVQTQVNKQTKDTHQSTERRPLNTQVAAERRQRTKISLDAYRQRQLAKAPELPIPELLHIGSQTAQQACQALRKDTEVSGSGVQNNADKKNMNALYPGTEARSEAERNETALAMPTRERPESRGHGQREAHQRDGVGRREWSLAGKSGCNHKQG